MKKFLIAIASVVFSSPFPLICGAAPYKFHIIAESGPTSVFLMVRTPTINNADQVAFSAVPSWTSGVSVLVRGSTNVLEMTSTDGKSDFQLLGGFPKITDAGRLVFQCTTNDSFYDPANVWISDITSTQLVFSGHVFDYPDFQEYGYGISFGPDTLFSFTCYTQSVAVIRRYHNGSQSIVVDDSGPYVLDAIYGSDIRSNGVISFIATSFGWPLAVVDTDGTNQVARATTNTYFAGFSDFASGGEDDLAIAGILTNNFLDFYGVVDLLDGTNVYRVYAESNTSFSVTYKLSLNDRREILFGRKPDFSFAMTEIFLSREGNPASLVVKVGDLLDGATIVDLDVSRHSINNKGNFTFYAELSDSRRVIVLAERQEDIPSVFTRIARSGTGIDLSFTGEVARAYVLQSTTNMQTWVDIALTNIIHLGTNVITDFGAPASFRAYRLRHP